MMCGRKIDQVFFDEASNISEESWEILIMRLKGSILKRIINWIKNLLGIKNNKCFIGADFAKDGTACFGYKNKKGEFVIDKITKI